MSHRKVVLRAMLYALSLMCRSDPPLNPLMEDDHRRHPFEVVSQGAIVLFVNVEWLTDMQKDAQEEWAPQLMDVVSYLLDECAVRSKKGGSHKMTPLGRTNVSVRRVVALAAGLCGAVLRACHRTLPGSIERAMQRLRQEADSVRRTYCGYDDGSSLLSDLEVALSKRTLYPIYREVLLWLNASLEVTLSSSDGSTTSTSFTASAGAGGSRKSDFASCSAAQPYSSASYVLGLGLYTVNQVRQCCSVSEAVCDAMIGYCLRCWRNGVVFACCKKNGCAMRQ